MKTLATLILSLIVLSGYSQEYFSFMDTNSTWRQTKLVRCGHGPSFMEYTRHDGQVYLRSDTMINNKIYKKLLFTGHSSYYLYNHGDTKNSYAFLCDYYYGAIREDSLKTIFFRDSTGHEKRLYSFNYQMGDSVNLHDDSNMQGYSKVKAIDSVWV